MFLEHISYGLRVNRIRKNVVDEFGSLNSSIKLASGDLLNNSLFVAWSKLSRSSSRMVFLVQVQLFTNPPNSRLPQPCFGLYLTQGKAFCKKRSNSSALSRRSSLYDDGLRQEMV
jgi:hypothetical protein